MPYTAHCSILCFKRVRYFFALLVLTAVWAAPTTLLAQKEVATDIFGNPINPEVRVNPVRKILNKFQVGFSMGYGSTYYNMPLDDFRLLSRPGVGTFLIPGGDSVRNAPYVAASNWLSTPQSNNNLFAAPGDYVEPDTTSLRLRARGASIPLMLTVHFTQDRLRIGGGVAFEWHTLESGEFRPETPILIDYQDQVRRNLQRKYFGSLAYRFHDWWYFSFAADLQVGILDRGQAFSGVRTTLFGGLGGSVEYNFSEYARVFARGSFEYRAAYTQPMPWGAEGRVRQLGTYVNFGISLNLPEARRCPISNCKIQTKHIHTSGRLYRGQSIWKINTPGVGENHRKLLKRKRYYRKYN